MVCGFAGVGVNLFMKRLLSIPIFLLAALSIRAANPAFTDFSTSQFNVSGNKVAIKSSVLLTNPVVNSGVISGNGSGLTNLSASAQTPWNQNINGAFFQLYNFGSLLGVNTNGSIGITLNSSSGSYVGGDADSSENATMEATSGSFSVGYIPNSFGSSVTSEKGSFSGGNGDASINTSFSTQNGAFAFGHAESATDGNINASEGSFSGGNILESVSATISSVNGSYSGGYLPTSSGSSVLSEDGSFSFGYLEISTNSSITSVDGGLSGGNLVGATASSIVSESSISYAKINDSVDASLIATDGSLGILHAENSSSVSLDIAQGSLVGIYASEKTNVSVSASRSMIVGAPTNEFTGSFESTVAVLGLTGVANGFDTNQFFGNGLGLTNIPEASIFVQTNTWGNAVVNFALGTSTVTNLAGNLTITGIVNFKPQYDWQTIELNPNGATRTLVIPAEWRQSGFTNNTTAAITNGTWAQLRVYVVPGICTNASLEIFQ